MLCIVEDGHKTEKAAKVRDRKCKGTARCKENNVPHLHFSGRRPSVRHRAAQKLLAYVTSGGAKKSRIFCTTSSGVTYTGKGSKWTQGRADTVSPWKRKEPTKVTVCFLTVVYRSCRL